MQGYNTVKEIFWTQIICHHNSLHFGALILLTEITYEKAKCRVNNNLTFLLKLTLNWSFLFYMCSICFKCISPYKGILFMVGSEVGQEQWAANNMVCFKPWVLWFTAASSSHFIYYALHQRRLAPDHWVTWACSYWACTSVHRVWRRTSPSYVVYFEQP